MSVLSALRGRQPQVESEPTALELELDGLVLSGQATDALSEAERLFRQAAWAYHSAHLALKADVTSQALSVEYYGRAANKNYAAAQSISAAMYPRSNNTND